MQERRRLEEALLDLSRANETLAGGGGGNGGKGGRAAALANVTGESAALLADLAMRSRTVGSGASPSGSPSARTEIQVRVVVPACAPFKNMNLYSTVVVSAPSARPG